jgi:hypothetical protein
MSGGLPKAESPSLHSNMYHAFVAYTTGTIFRQDISGVLSYTWFIQKLVY